MSDLTLHQDACQRASIKIATLLRGTEVASPRWRIAFVEVTRKLDGDRAAIDVRLQPLKFLGAGPFPTRAWATARSAVAAVLADLELECERGVICELLTPERFGCAGEITGFPIRVAIDLDGARITADLLRLAMAAAHRDFDPGQIVGRFSARATDRRVEWQEGLEGAGLRFTASIDEAGVFGLACRVTRAGESIEEQHVVFQEADYRCAFAREVGERADSFRRNVARSQAPARP
jgi:hypothetical protein